MVKLYIKKEKNTVPYKIGRVVSYMSIVNNICSVLLQRQIMLNVKMIVNIKLQDIS